MKNLVKFWGIIAFTAIIGGVFTACNEPEISALTGTVSISGIAEVGQLLTADTSALGGSL